MKKSNLACLAALALLAAAPCAAHAQGGEDGARREQVVARLKKAQAEGRRVEVKFKHDFTLTGRVGEMRERGFTFELDGLGPELRRQNAAAVILYEDVTSVRYPSKVKSFFKKAGYGLVLAGAFVVVAPLYGGAFLLSGNIPPGCP